MDYAFINVQCTSDEGEVGTFLTREAGRDDRKPISPVFDSLAELLPWMTLNGWSLDEHTRESQFVPWRVSKPQ